MDGSTFRFAAAALILSGLSAGLAGVVYRELSDTAEVPVAPADTAANERGLSGRTTPPGATNLPPLDRYSEVTQRPLFSATRQPPPPEAAGDANGKSNFALIGIVITRDARTALIQHGQPPTLARLKEGQGIDGWIVESIFPDRVTLGRGAAQQELKPKAQASPVRPAPLAAPRG